MYIDVGQLVCNHENIPRYVITFFHGPHNLENIPALSSARKEMFQFCLHRWFCENDSETTVFAQSSSVALFIYPLEDRNNFKLKIYLCFR